ncbi:MAG: hypothetical protein FJ288_12955 [Planctomycetes bacterium]|nr:hypothetical protein [Planctomycetota bacterium]
MQAAMANRGGARGACLAALLALGVIRAAAGAQPDGASVPAEEKEAAALDRIDKWLDKTKVLAPWLSWGADLRFRNDYTSNANLNRHLVGRESNWQRVRTRWWTTLTPVKDVDLNVRITYEGRHFSQPHGTPDFEQIDALIDTLNVRLTNFLGSPLTLTLGRQDILLGDGWLVYAGGPLDGTRTVFFDAARVTLDLKPAQTTADFIYIDQDYNANRWIEPLHNENLSLSEQDERGFILWLTNRTLKNTEINGYYMYQNMEPVLRRADNGFIHTFGARVAGDLGDRWRYRAEGAHQFGDRNDRSLRAFGFNGALTFLVKDAHDTQVRCSYEYLSGDDPGTRATEAFAPLWGRWDRWSQILITTWALETRAREITNLHRVGPGLVCTPAPRLELSADYYLLFADENSMTGAANRANFSAAGRFRGQLLQNQVRYQFTRHLKGRILTEFFFPGNYYTDFRNDVAAFLRGELYFTW